MLNPEQNRLQRIAGIIVNTSLTITSQDRLHILYNTAASQLVDLVEDLATRRGAVITRQYDNPRETAAFLSAATLEDVRARYEPERVALEQRISQATKTAMILSLDPDAYLGVDNKLIEERQRILAPIGTMMRYHPWVYMSFPSRAEASLEGLHFPEYAESILAACDRDWDVIAKAQEILIEETLNPAKQIEFYAGRQRRRWSTQLIMSIEGQTFANSTVLRNIPGSEIFSSPVRGTLQGQLVIQRPIMFGARKLPNLSLTFTNGKVMDFYIDGGTKEDIDWVDMQMAIAGGREVGEVGLGMNRALNRPYLNRLYVEKIGGTGHIAVGFSYPDKEYAGKPVQIDNGVRSSIHHDLTFFMLPEYGGGQVIADGRVIQEDGNFLDPRLSILNLVK